MTSHPYPLSLDELPHEILANIAERLPGCGPEGLPLALNSMYNLVCVSKKMHLVFNDLHITRRFLKTCAEKYGKEVEELAPHLKTMGAYLFLRRYIYANHLDDMYQVTQQLYSLTSQMCREAEELFLVKRRVLCIDAYDGARYLFTGQIQTVKGLVCYVNWQCIKLAHPFGVIMIYNDCWERPELSGLIYSVAAALIDFFQAHFRGFIANLYNGAFDRIVNWHRHTLCQVIPIQPSSGVMCTKIEIIDSKLFNEEEVGQTLILSRGPSHHSCYICQRAFETVLPQLSMPISPITPARHRLMRTLFWMLEKKEKVGAPKVSIDSSSLNLRGRSRRKP